ncbi:MAG: cystathionine beta-synthase [Bacteroidetes bacterium QH_8_67_23]|jgi:cystathionine beta-synthase|nr:MAG: cystathionine beta-synthase [Bacteroidetes bacterium QH_8_67_23]
MWHENVLGTVGQTPLVRLRELTAGLPCPVLAKVEFFNPGGSVKDRIGQYMIERAEEAGDLQPGGTIVEGTSGNTGAGLALAAIARGYRCIFTTTDKQSEEKADVLRALGAEVRVCPTNVEPDDPRSYYSVARRLAAELPNAVYLNQYDNPANTEAHYETTGPELWEQTEGRITHFISGAGTGGTISGVAKFLKEKKDDVSVVGVDPRGSVYHKYFHTGEFDEGEIYPYFTEGVGEDILAENMDFSLVDDYVQVGDKEAMQMTRRLAQREGLFIGQSSGMAMAGALGWLHAHRETLDEDDVVVVLFPDSGFRYLSKTYDDDWMRDHDFLEPTPQVTVGEVLRMRRQGQPVVAVGPEDTLGDAIGQMTDQGLSQLPVIDRGADGEAEVVGSLTEARILHLMIESPETRDELVREAMEAPFPVVPRSMDLGLLSTYLEEEAGAVLVAPNEAPSGDGVSSGGAHSAGYEIITKSDLITALSQAG